MTGKDWSNPRNKIKAFMKRQAKRKLFRLEIKRMVQLGYIRHGGQYVKLDD